jgi:hypothetical protein
LQEPQLFYFKDRQGDLIVEMVLWQLHQPLSGSLHGFKYRLFCGEWDVCHVRYDNESGKGDHVHFGKVEKPYRFANPKQLLDDFWADVARLTAWRFS